MNRAADPERGTFVAPPAAGGEIDREGEGERFAKHVVALLHVQHDRHLAHDEPRRAHHVRPGERRCALLHVSVDDLLGEGRCAETGPRPRRSLDGALLLPFDESAVLPVSGALVTGTLTPLGEDLQPRDPNRAPTEREKRLYVLDNALAGGRIKAEQLMGAIGTVDTSPPGSPAAYLCEQASWELARKGICDAVDLASAPSLDFDPAAKCDSLSSRWGSASSRSRPSRATSTRRMSRRIRARRGRTGSLPKPARCRPTPAPVEALARRAALSA